MTLARKVLQDSLPSTLSQFARALGLVQKSNDSLSHFLIVACGNDITSLALNNCFARAAHVRHNGWPRCAHIFEDRIRESFSAGTQHADIRNKQKLRDPIASADEENVLCNS